MRSLDRKIAMSRVKPGVGEPSVLKTAQENFQLFQETAAKIAARKAASATKSKYAATSVVDSKAASTSAPFAESGVSAAGAAAIADSAVDISDDDELVASICVPDSAGPASLDDNQQMLHAAQVHFIHFQSFNE